MSHQLETIIGYKFKHPELLETALTHTSYANETRPPVKHNERLEFLGDSVLQIVSADYLFHAYADRPEGDLTRIRSSLVSEGALFQFAQEINLGDYLRLGRGEEHCGGRTRPSVVSDAFEALIAALYLDGGMEVARNFILPFITEGKYAEADYKTRLQEIVQQNPEEKLSYVVEQETGPDHNKHFVVAVRFNSDCVARGEGRSKKMAEQHAAREALNNAVCPSAAFTDVEENVWYHDGIDFMVRNGYMNGVAADTCDVEGSLTRAQLVTSLYRIAGEPETSAAIPFADVADGQWYTKAIVWAAENGIVKGVNETTFAPNDPITREQIAVILYRYAHEENTEDGKLTSFPDAKDISGYALEAMNWAVARGLINGSDGKLLPQDTATRAQIAVILARYLNA